MTTPLRVRNLLVDQGFEIVLERRMRFGCQSAPVRALLAGVGAVLQPWMLRPLIRLFIEGYQNDPRIYLRENFTTIARWPDSDAARLRNAPET